MSELHPQIAHHSSLVMIDIHCHILPNFDDGAESLAESLAMAEIAAATGIRTIIATPHVDQPDQAGSILESVEALQAAIDERGIELQVLPGAEVFPSPAVPDWLEDGVPIAIGKGYILLDCPLMNVPLGLDQLVFRLQAHGVTPILAHPERVLPIQKRPQLLEELVHAGMLIQLDAMSILGKHGSAAAKTAHVLLRHRWAHFLASDAHSSNHSRPQLARAAHALRSIIGDARVRQLVQENPLRLLKGESIYSDPADYSPPRMWAFLRR